MKASCMLESTECEEQGALMTCVSSKTESMKVNYPLISKTLYVGC